MSRPVANLLFLDCRGPMISPGQWPASFRRRPPERLGPGAPGPEFRIALLGRPGGTHPSQEAARQIPATSGQAIGLAILIGSCIFSVATAYS